MIRFARVGVAFVLLVAGAGCTQETQNQIGRSIQNWTGTDGVLDENQNLQADPGEKKVYFEVPDFATYIFYESPR